MDELTIFKALEVGFKDSSLPREYRERLRQRVLTVLIDSPLAVNEVIAREPIDATNVWWYTSLLENGGKHWPDASLWNQTMEQIAERQGECRKELDAALHRARGHFVPPVSKRPTNMSVSQQAVFNALAEMAAVYFGGNWRDLGIQPRIQPLLAAPSGSGKSYLLRNFAAAQKLPMLRLSYAEWLPRGSRTQPDTATRIHAFLEDHERSMIFLDELDKLRPFDSDWGTSMLTEAFLLLDRTLIQPGFSKSPSTDARVIQRLQQSTFIVGAGAWQETWSNYERPLGFGPAPEHNAVNDILGSRKIPEELLRRFGGTPLILPPANADELRELAVADGLDQAAAEVGCPLDYRAGEISRRGMRWLEDCRLEVEIRRNAARDPDYLERNTTTHGLH